MYIHGHTFSVLYVHDKFHKKYVHVCMMCMYYSIVHTRHIMDENIAFMDEKCCFMDENYSGAGTSGDQQGLGLSVGT